MRNSVVHGMDDHPVRFAFIKRNEKLYQFRVPLTLWHKLSATKKNLKTIESEERQ